jgi:hypothetical protein
MTSFAPHHHVVHTNVVLAINIVQDGIVVVEPHLLPILINSVMLICVQKKNVARTIRLAIRFNVILIVGIRNNYRFVMMPAMTSEAV